MTKELLLPHSFKKIGWVILIPTLLLGVLMLIDGFNGYPTYLMPAQGTACYETLCSNDRPCAEQHRSGGHLHRRDILSLLPRTDRG